MWPLVQSGDACLFHPIQSVTAEDFCEKWWDFCEKSDNIYSTAVMSWAAEYMCFLDDHGEMRWHSVAGMVHRDGEWQLCLPAATA